MINRRRQSGSLLIMALFVAIVLLALGLALSRVIQGSAQANAIEFYGSKAFFVAQSGIEVNLNRLFPINGGAASCANTLNPDFSNTANMEACSVNVACDELLNVNDTNSPTGTVNIFRLTSTASCDSGRFITQRSINVEAKTIN